jgi:hypothetical protein
MYTTMFKVRFSGDSQLPRKALQLNTKSGEGMATNNYSSSSNSSVVSSVSMSYASPPSYTSTTIAAISSVQGKIALAAAVTVEPNMVVAARWAAAGWGDD